MKAQNKFGAEEPLKDNSVLAPGRAQWQSCKRGKMEVRQGMEGLDYDPQELAQVCRSRGVRRVTLFGSRARGDARPDSDVDLLIDYDPASRMSMFQFLDLEEELGNLFHGLKVDAVSSHGISPYFKNSILSTTRVLYDQ